MKKLFLAIMVAMSTVTFAQTQKGNYLIETETTFNQQDVNTGIGYYSTKNGDKKLNVGVSGGYFVAKNLALKAGVGYGTTIYDSNTLSSVWSYRAGAEYYINGLVPVQVTWSGASVKNLKYDPSYISTQVGYAWFVNKNLLVKPFVRYDIALTNHYNDGFGVGVGFGYIFK